MINVPIAIAVVAIALRGVPESRDDDAVQRLDVPGAILATLGLGALTFGLIGAQARTSPLAGGVILGGVVILIAFVAVERRGRAPMLPLDLFRSRAFSGANVYTLLLYAALGGSLYFLPYLLVDIQHYTPTAAGAAGLPFVVLMFALSRWSGGLVARIGARMPLVVGALLAATAFLAYARPGLDESYWTSYFPAAVLLGLGGACFVAPLTTTVFEAVDTEQSGDRVRRQQRRRTRRGPDRDRRRSASCSRASSMRVRRAHRRPARQRADGARSRTTTARDSTPGTVPHDVPARDRNAVAAAVRDGYLAGIPRRDDRVRAAVHRGGCRCAALDSGARRLGGDGDDDASRFDGLSVSASPVDGPRGFSRGGSCARRRGRCRTR